MRERDRGYIPPVNTAKGVASNHSPFSFANRAQFCSGQPVLCPANGLWLVHTKKHFLLLSCLPRLLVVQEWPCDPDLTDGTWAEVHLVVGWGGDGGVARGHKKKPSVCFPDKRGPICGHYSHSETKEVTNKKMKASMLRMVGFNIRKTLGPWGACWVAELWTPVYSSYQYLGGLLTAVKYLPKWWTGFLTQSKEKRLRAHAYSAYFVTNLLNSSRSQHCTR